MNTILLVENDDADAELTRRGLLESAFTQEAKR